MERVQTSRTRRGFTAVEMLVVIAITGILAALGVPLLQNFIHRAKMEGLTANASTLMRLARSEAIKANVRTVVRFDIDNRRFIAFADLNGPLLGDAPDGVFNPIAGEPNRTTDYRVGAPFDLPVGVELQAPGALDLIDGFTTVDNGGIDEQVAIFQSDGSITDIGGLRLGDARDNFFEVRVAPLGTARVRVLKWNDVEADWFEQGQEGHLWEWS